MTSIQRLIVLTGVRLVMTKIYEYSCVECSSTWEGTRPQRGKRCKPCSSKQSSRNRTDSTKTTCSKCGGKKSYQANFCRGCRDQNGVNNHMYGKTQPHLTELNLAKPKEDHWNWRGGKPRKRDGKSQQWGVNVRKVGKCCICDSTDSLEAHHLESYNLSGDLRWEQSNGVCLCNTCHVDFHKQYGFGNNTTEQFNEYKENCNDSN